MNLILIKNLLKLDYKKCQNLISKVEKKGDEMMSNEEYYTVSDISEKYQISRSKVYYYFEKYKNYLSDDKVKAINRQGLKKILNDLNITLDEEKEIHIKEDNTLLIKQYEERIRAKNAEIERLSSLLESQLKSKDIEIERLSNLLEKQIELNKNNQILLKSSMEKVEALEEEKKEVKKESFFSRIFKRKN